MPTHPDVSILIPARNEGARIAPTIRSIARARTTASRLEFVIVDDASDDQSMTHLLRAIPKLLDEPRIDIRVLQLTEHSGNYRARNQAAEAASADIFFVTDAHVQFSKGWDELVLRHVHPDRIIAGTITQRGTPFHGYGVRLMVPLMGTSWVRERHRDLSPVPIAVCSATVLTKQLFQRLNGYDTGMIQYGGGEAEFCIRAWLEGAEVVSLPDLEVQHEFKQRRQFVTFLESVRLYWVHNCIRFGLLYLSELGCMQLLRFYARAFPVVYQGALELVAGGDVWLRRASLEQRQQRSFSWLVEHFGIRDQLGGELL